MKRKGKYVQLELPFEHLDDEEIWKDIKGYDGLYQASNLGRIRSLNFKRTGKEKLLKPSLNRNGYQQVKLCKNGKAKRYFVHRLVYEAFNGEIHEGMQVNHKDENPQNNILSNIDTLMTPKENMNWGTRNKRIAKALSKHVIQKSLDGKVVKVWSSVMEIQRKLGYNHGSICSCCRGGRYDRGIWYYVKSAYGYIWEYEEAG